MTPEQEKLLYRLEAIEPQIAKIENAAKVRKYFEDKIIRAAKNLAMMEAFGSYIETDSNGRENICSVSFNDRKMYVDQFMSDIKFRARDIIHQEIT